MKEEVNLIFWIGKKIKKRIPAILVLIGCQAASALLGVAFALGTRKVIDSAIAGDEGVFLRACILQGGIILGILLTLTVARHLRDRLTADLDRDWKRDLLQGFLHGEYEKVSAYHSGELLNRLNNDVRIIDEGLITSIPNLVSMVTKLVSAMIVLVALEPLFSVLVITAGVAVVFGTGFLRKKLKVLHKQVSTSEGKVSGFIQETLENLLMVQAMDVTGEIGRRADVLLEERYVLQRKRKNVSLFANTSISTMSYLAGFVALVWCAVDLLHGKISFGTLTAVTQLVAQLQGPFVNLSGAIPRYAALTAAAERLMELDDCRIEEKDCATQIDDAVENTMDAVFVYSRMTALCGENITFSYDRDKVLEDASFVLPKGSFACITGPSGIGKSTLLKLMLGLFKLDEGCLYADCGARKVHLDRSSRGLFAYVPQGNLLFSGTLRENLTLTRPDATEEEIRQAVYVSAMDEYLDELPQGLDTVVGENAVGLSEGQAQRLAIARAILGGAPVLLLDEITSSLDSASEAKVLGRIRELEDRTCIVVTHRPAAVELADWCLEVDHGRIECKEKEKEGKVTK